MYHASILSAEL